MTIQACMELILIKNICTFLYVLMLSTFVYDPICVLLHTSLIAKFKWGPKDTFSRGNLNLQGWLKFKRGPGTPKDTRCLVFPNSNLWPYLTLCFI